MNIFKILSILVVLVGLCTVNVEGSLTLLLLLKLVALKGAIFLGVPLAFGAFLLGQGIGFLGGTVAGGFKVLHVAHKVRKHHEAKVGAAILAKTKIRPAVVHAVANVNIPTGWKAPVVSAPVISTSGWVATGWPKKPSLLTRFTSFPAKIIKKYRRKHKHPVVWVDSGHSHGWASGPSSHSHGAEYSGGWESSVPGGSHSDDGWIEGPGSSSSSSGGYSSSSGGYISSGGSPSDWPSSSSSSGGYSSSSDGGYSSGSPSGGYSSSSGSSGSSSSSGGYSAPSSGGYSSPSGSGGSSGGYSSPSSAAGGSSGGYGRRRRYGTRPTNLRFAPPPPAAPVADRRTMEATEELLNIVPAPKNMIEEYLEKKLREEIRTQKSESKKEDAVQLMSMLREVYVQELATALSPSTDGTTTELPDFVPMPLDDAVPNSTTMKPTPVPVTTLSPPAKTNKDKNSFLTKFVPVMKTSLVLTKKQVDEKNQLTTTDQADSQLLTTFKDDVKKFFLLVSLLDQDQCLQKLVCDIHSKAMTPNLKLSAYEKNIVTTFKIMGTVFPESSDDSTAVYRKAAKIGETSTSFKPCSLSFKSCTYSTDDIIKMGNEVVEKGSSTTPKPKSASAQKLI